MTSSMDIGFIEVADDADLSDMIRFADTGYYTPPDPPLSEPVTLVSFSTQTRDGFLLDKETVWFVKYNNKEVIIKNILLLGSTPSKADSKTVSGPGDSGGLVMHTATGKLVGIILGGNAKFTWALPVDEILNFNSMILV